MPLVLVYIIVAYVFINYVVCDVDPSDTASILLEQLRVQTRQLAIVEKLHTDQIAIQRQQLKILQQLNTDNYLNTILVSVACTVFGFLAMLVLKRLLMMLYLRYNISPEMPQTTQLMDFAVTEIESPRHGSVTVDLSELERLRSARQKSPANQRGRYG